MKLQDLLTQVNVGEQTVFDVATATDGGKKLTVQVRKMPPEDPRPPVRAESPARAHTFFGAEGFAEYLANYGTPHTVVFADPAAERMSAVLDETGDDPVDEGVSIGFEIVTMKPQTHPLWKPWADIAGNKVPLARFAEFVAQNRRAIVKPDGKTLALMLSQVRATVNVEIQRGRGKDAVNGLVVTTRIQGQDKKETIELPDEIVLSVPLYVGTPAQAIELDLCLEAQANGEVNVLVCAGTVAEARVVAFEAMIAVVKKRLDKMTVVLGAPAHKPWDYLAEKP